MPAARRPAALAAAPAPAVMGLLDLGFYSGGFTLPEGDYAMLHDIILWAPKDANGNQKGDLKLYARLTAYPLNGGEPQEQLLSMGSKAHESWMPSADGKNVVARPGGSGQQPNNKTNWSLYLQSLHNADPSVSAALAGQDFTALDGVWVHTQNV